jgi:hypothetical protein
MREQNFQTPELRLAHLRTLTNNSGIIQHGLYGMPNQKTGYCTDDNCRAFLVSVLAYRRNKDPELLRLIGLYLSFLRFARNDEGQFRNFMSFQQFFLDDRGSDDCQGRTLWALGTAIRIPPHETVREICEDLFEAAFTWLPDLVSDRGLAYSLLGLRQYHMAKPEDPRPLEMVNLLADRLATRWETNAVDTWYWFERRLTYANGIPPMAMLLAGEVTGNLRYTDIGLKGLNWLNGVLFEDGVLTPIGCNGWYQRGRKRHDWDQQAIDPAGMVGANLTAHRVTKDKAYHDLAVRSFEWFLGRNTLGLPLVDPVTGGCYDGLAEHGVNKNQGAESCLVYYLAHMALYKHAPVAVY